MNQRGDAVSFQLAVAVLLCLALAACGGNGDPNTPPPPPTITGLSVSCGGTTSIFTGQTLQCTAAVKGTGNYSSAVSWSASAGTISSAGLFTAPASAGNVTITATSRADPTKSGSVTVTVSTAPPPTITSVSASCASSSVVVGQTLQCTATVLGTGSYSTAVTWSASAGAISSAGLFTAPAAAGQVTITATSVADTTKSGSTTVTVTATAKAAFDYKGVTHVSWWQGDYSTATGTASQDAIAPTGSTWAGLLVTQYMATRSSNTITSTVQTPTDADLVAAINELHGQGLKVMLKPHIDISDGTWRAQIAPTDVAAWFQSFTTFITHYAQLAQTNGVEMLCFGTEYASMSGSAHHAAWQNVIAAIRAVYTGKLAYAANATYAGDEFTVVSFWDEVDVIGLDAYFPLTNLSDPSVAQLVAAWSYNKNGENIVQNVTNFAAAHPGKPVIFTEIGYRSVAGANIAPWDYSSAGTVDNAEQQNCYEAMYRVWGQRTATLKGNFWWAWPVNPPAANDTDYTPRNKPAMTTMQNWLIP